MTSMNRLRIYQVSPADLIDLRAGRKQIDFEMSRLPDDFRVVAASRHATFSKGTIALRVTSEAFDEVPEGNTIYDWFRFYVFDVRDFDEQAVAKEKFAKILAGVEP